jgi:cell division protein FtsW (lipid II flippase)
MNYIMERIVVLTCLSFMGIILIYSAYMDSNNSLNMEFLKDIKLYLGIASIALGVIISLAGRKRD